jgi:hypothetical protein
MIPRNGVGQKLTDLVTDCFPLQPSEAGVSGRPILPDPQALIAALIADSRALIAMQQPQVVKDALRGC